MRAEDLIEKYKLVAHPEGGWYKETYRSIESIADKALPERFLGDRSFSTAIYFLLEGGDFSAFHKINSDECWHFYAGEALIIYIINKEDGLDVIRLGNNIDKGEVFQFVVPANCWFASKPSSKNGFSFVGCTVAPGFDFNDFEMATYDTLSELYPQHKDTILSLCRL